jgi:hypothetical protein
MNHRSRVRKLISTILGSAMLGMHGAAALAGCTIYVSHNDDASPPFWTFGGGAITRCCCARQ